MHRPLILAAALLLASACTTRNPLAVPDSGPDTTWDGEPGPDLPWRPPDYRVPPPPDFRVVDFWPRDHNVPPPLDIGVPDVGMPDVGLPAQSCAAVAGRPCISDSQCSGHLCAMTDPLHKRGVCGCKCTPDNPSTPLVNEDSCPKLTGALLSCGSVPAGKGTTRHVCLRECKPALNVANPCHIGTACDPRSTQFGQGVDHAFCALPACTKDADCPTQTGQQCGAGSPCGGGATCEPFVAGSAQGRCVVAGRCDTQSGLCLPRLKSGAQKVGGACKADFDCAGNAHCELPVDNATLRKPFGALCMVDDQCCSGKCDASGRCTQGLCAEHSRNGMCVIDGCSFLYEFKCPGGSTCVRTYPGGRCLATCKPGVASSCRGFTGDRYGDYECRDWSKLSINGVLVANQPVCEWGDAVQCNGTHLVGRYGSSALSCSVFGAQCRALDGSLITNTTKVGLCLDNTASGP